MTKGVPDYTIARNPHVFVHCGPLEVDEKEIGRDFTIKTSGGNEFVNVNNGNYRETIRGFSGEVVGVGGDPSQSGRIGKAIVAKSGDIVFNAEGGDIYLKAKNIYLSASDGEEGKGNIMAECNGYLQLATGGEFRLAASRMCFISEGNMNFVGQMMVSGSFHKGSSVASAGFLSSILSGNWASLITSITQSCK
tara:strand:- start:3068 stop:3646 length:579 start_codon:yes stop_codon:yes gene_type:complete